MKRRVPLSRNVEKLRAWRRRSKTLRRHDAIPTTTRLLVLERSGFLCVCGCGHQAQEVHHVFPKRLWPGLANDPDNMVAMTARCHARHETRFLPLSRRALPFEVWRLAYQDDQRTVYLETTYPA